MFSRFSESDSWLFYFECWFWWFVNNFRPILVGLKERFNLQAMVTDPYFGQNAVDAGLMKTFGRTFGDVMILLLIAFIMNILLVRFQKYTKLRAVLQQGMFRFNKQLPLSGFYSLFS